MGDDDTARFHAALDQLGSDLSLAVKAHNDDTETGRLYALRATIGFLRAVGTDRPLLMPLYDLQSELERRGNLKPPKQDMDEVLAVLAIELRRKADGTTLADAAKRVTAEIGWKGRHSHLLTRRRNKGVWPRDIRAFYDDMKKWIESQQSLPLKEKADRATALLRQQIAPTA